MTPSGTEGEQLTSNFYRHGPMQEDEGFDDDDERDDFREEDEGQHFGGGMGDQIPEDPVGRAGA